MCWHCGGTSLKHDSRWRELHVVGQTVTIAPGSYLIGGRVHLGMDPGPRANHYGIERSSDRAASLAAPLPLARVTPAVEAGDYVHRLVNDPKEQRIRKSSAPSAADVSVDNREMLWRRSNPVDDPLDFRSKANGQFRIAGAIPIARRDQFSPCSGTKNDRRHGQRRCRSSALSWSHGMLCSRS